MLDYNPFFKNRLFFVKKKERKKGELLPYSRPVAACKKMVLLFGHSLSGLLAQTVGCVPMPIIKLGETTSNGRLWDLLAGLASSCVSVSLR